MSDFARGQESGRLGQAATIISENFRTAEQARLEQSGDPSYWRSKRYSLIEFLRRPSKVWLADKFIGERDFVMIFGASGAGKTHVVLDAALAFCMGRTFTHLFPVNRPLSVAYCTGEGAGGLADRLRALNAHFEPPPDVQLFFYEDTPQLIDIASENGVLAFLAGWLQDAKDGLVPSKLDVLIIDTLHNSAVGSDENSAKDVSNILASMRMLRDALGCAIILVHHANKMGSSERGSTALRAACDTVVRVNKDGRTYTMLCEKLKDGEPWPAQTFQLAGVGSLTKGVRVWWIENASGVTDDGTTKKLTNADKAVRFLHEHEGEKFTAAEIAQEIGLSEGAARNIYRDLNALKKAGSVSSDVRGKSEPDLWYYKGAADA